jgi:beta-glucosidase
VIAYYYFNQDAGYLSQAGLEDDVDNRGNHSALARQIAAESLVLLKNKNNALPLNRPRTLSIFGAHAGAITAGPNNELSVVGSDDVYYGHAAGLGGSGEQSYTYLITPWYALTTKVMQHGTQFRWIMNNTGYDGSSGAAAGYSSGTGATHSYSAYASGSEVCICFLNAYSGEGGDRSELTDSEMDTMVNNVASNCNNTVVVINAVAPRLVDAWIENENVTALLYGGMLGEQSGNAIVDVLYGDVVPSGKLTYTIAKNESDYGATLCTTAVCNFTEGNYIDYKYFDKYNVTPRFEYGFGLSYTNFTYASDLTISSNSTLRSGLASGARAVGGREDLWDIVVTASIKITNTGSRAGAETAQLYIAFPEEANEPVRQLRGFDKVKLEAGDSGVATFQLRKRDLMYWDVTSQDWRVASGEYTLYAGASSRDLKASATLTV